MKLVKHIFSSLGSALNLLAIAFASVVLHPLFWFLAIVYAIWSALSFIPTGAIQ